MKTKNKQNWNEWAKCWEMIISVMFSLTSNNCSRSTLQLPKYHILYHIKIKLKYKSMIILILKFQKALWEKHAQNYQLLKTKNMLVDTVHFWMAMFVKYAKTALVVT